ncbi:MAG TPA: Minf_1886 family protein [Gemmataceae bacterium]|jgi:uncharacterized repeat protein (TIGR04138 family)
MHHPKLDEVVQGDPRYTYEAYEFVFAALAHTQRLLGRVPPQEGSSEQDYHVSGPQLLDGIRDLALREYGLLARTVFRLWGINSTADVGEIVFNLVEANLMSKTAQDARDDFRDVYDLDQVLVRDYRIDFKDEVEEGS